MCGIAGMASTGGGVSARFSLDAMMARIAHRGPDDHGTWHSADGRVAFGHRRLAIIDLSPAGHQPMTDETGRLWLTFNGEIYNFLELREELEREGVRFRTHSDSEVILCAYRRWGTRCVERFNGMFAFAIHDAEAERLFMARDRIGKKPLYYSHDGANLLFASEAKAVTAGGVASDLDPDALNAYFTYGYVPGEQSIFALLRRLLPGHVMTYDLKSGELRSWPYWTPDASLERIADGADTEELLARLDALLDDSVRLRMIADVPVGVLLSGGVDSSLITAMAARHSSRPVKTFTVAFPGGGRYDESAHARIVADHFSTDHHELPLPQPGIDDLKWLAGHLDEPLADPSILPTYLISRLTRQHVTVALGGDGGDELFGGYGWYRQGIEVEQRLRRIPRPLRRAASFAVGWLPAGVRGRNFVRAHADDLCHYMITTTSTFGPDLRRKLLRPEVLGQLSRGLVDPERSRRSRWPARVDAMRQMSILDLHTWLPDDILAKVDRASMAVALEVRAPLLDYRIIEFALASVPSPLKVGEGGSRFLQRELARRILPRELDLNRKQGFVMPVNDWLRGSWGDLTLDLLTSTEAGRWVDPAVAKSLLEGQRKGRFNAVRLFNLLMFALWLDGRRERTAVCGAAA